MSAFLHKVSIYAEPGKSRFLEVIVNHDNGLAPGGIDYRHRNVLIEDVSTDEVFDMLRFAIGRAIASIESAYHITVADDLTDDEILMLREQYEKRDRA